MNKDLTTGNVVQSILRMAIPIIGTSFMQLAYSFTDMLWLGKLGSQAVAAVGTAGFYGHLGWAIASIILVGCGIMVSQAVGKKDEQKAQYLTQNALVGLLIITISYFILIQFSYDSLIGFFELNDIETEQMAHTYLRWSSFGLIFMLTSRMFGSVSNARGNSKFPFMVGTVGTVLNIILDPIFIFVLDLGVLGAVWATIIAQMTVTALYIIYRAKQFLGKRATWTFSLEPIQAMIKLGFPPSTQFIVFSLVAMTIGKIVSGFGSHAIAAQKIGLQIEAITFMTIGGINGAILSFTGQNFGAKQYKRVREGYRVGLKVSIIFGGIMTLIFYNFAEHMVMWFVQDPETVKIGASYLRIVGLSQIFMCVDLMSTGVINGIGKTKWPASSNIAMILLRIPLAIWLSADHRFGIEGVWMALLISTMLRGLVNSSMYLYLKPRVLPIKSMQAK